MRLRTSDGLDLDMLDQTFGPTAMLSDQARDAPGTERSEQEEHQGRKRRKPSTVILEAVEGAVEAGLAEVKEGRGEGGGSEIENSEVNVQNCGLRFTSDTFFDKLLTIGPGLTRATSGPIRFFQMLSLLAIFHFSIDLDYFAASFHLVSKLCTKALSACPFCE